MKEGTVYMAGLPTCDWLDFIPMDRSIMASLEVEGSEETKMRLFGALEVLGRDQK